MTTGSLLATLLALAPLPAGSPGGAVAPCDIGICESGLGGAPFLEPTGPGADFVAVGAATARTVAGPGVAPTEPFALVLPALPAGAVWVDTIVAWSWLHWGVAAPAADTIRIGGVPVNGGLCGTGEPFICWFPDAHGSSYVAQLGPGALPLGVPLPVEDATDRPIGAPFPTFLGEGLTVVLVYEAPDTTPRTVQLWCGYTSTESDQTLSSQAIADLALAYPFAGTDLHLLLNAFDGHSSGGAGDTTTLQGIPVGGVLAGTGTPSDTWQGLLGLGASNNLYDHLDDDVSSMVGWQDPVLAIRTQSLGDCLGHTFAAASYPVVPLSTDVAGVSTSTGGVHQLHLAAGPGSAGDLYWFLGSLTGDSPGFDSDGFHFPLNIDAWTVFTVQNPNVLPLVQSLGFLDASGQPPVTPGLAIPPGVFTQFTGAVFHHAALVLSSVDTTLRAVTNSARCELLP
jgi:hypothetical protein